MIGHNSLCGDASSLDVPVVSLCGQQAFFDLTLGQALNGGGGGNSIKKQDFTNQAILQQSHKADSSYGLRKVQVSTGLSPGNGSSAGLTPIFGCREVNVSSTLSDMEPVSGKYAQAPDIEPGITETACENVDLALSIVPYTEPVTLECEGEFAGRHRPFATPIPTMARNVACPTVVSRPDPEGRITYMSLLPNHLSQPTAAGSSPRSNVYSYVQGQCVAQPDDANRTLHSIWSDNHVSHSSSTVGECLAQPSTANPAHEHACLANTISHGRASREQTFQASLSSVGERIGDKKQFTGLLLPDSLARSFDSTEMDKIAKAIVRVNEFGSSSATISASKQKNRPTFAQEPGDGREIVGLRKVIPRVLPSVGAFTVQCAKCYKWRLVPSKEQYEQIRQHILEKPFFCSSTSTWQPGASCDDPPELCEDKNFVWAIDKPNIPLAPSGWERLLVIRSEGCSKFADIYYVAPSGKKLRSMPDIERYLSEHPELVDAGVSLSQFSFVIPRALDENYCRKRTPGLSNVMRGSITHKNTSSYNLGVRSQHLKVPYVRKFPVEHIDHRHFAAQPLECRELAIGQSSVNHSDNAPLAVEPLRAWDADNHAMMLACHGGVGHGSLANACLQ